MTSASNRNHGVTLRAASVAVGQGTQISARREPSWPTVRASKRPHVAGRHPYGIAAYSMTRPTAGNPLMLSVHEPVEASENWMRPPRARGRRQEDVKRAPGPVCLSLSCEEACGPAVPDTAMTG